MGILYAHLALPTTAFSAHSIQKGNAMRKVMHNRHFWFKSVYISAYNVQNSISCRFYEVAPFVARYARNQNRNTISEFLAFSYLRKICLIAIKLRRSSQQVNARRIAFSGELYTTKYIAPPVVFCCDRIWSTYIWVKAISTWRYVYDHQTLRFRTIFNVWVNVCVTREYGLFF